MSKKKNSNEERFLKFLNEENLLRFLGKEKLAKYLKLNTKLDNLSRKIIHSLSAFAICLFPYIFTIGQIIFLCALFALIFISGHLFNFLGIINKVKRSSWGDVFYPLGVLISVLLFLPHHVAAFQFGVLVLGFSDTLANIVGSLWGKHKVKILGGSKSLEGSSAFFLSVILLLFFFSLPALSFNISAYLLIALILTFLESVLVFGLDNLILPALAAYLFTLI